MTVPHPSRPSVSVVICAYTQRRWDLLCRSVDSVLAQTLPADQIIVVVDHNDDLFRRAATDRRFAAVTVLRHTGPPGLSGARNRGVAESTGEIVAFLDDDASAADGWLSALLTGYQDPQVIGVGGRIEPVWPRRRPALLCPELDWLVGCTYRGMPMTGTEIRNMIGANMSFRRWIFDAIGGFRTDIGRTAAAPLGGEETELCIRAGAATGGRFRYAADAVVAHHVAQDRTGWRYLLRRAWAEGLSKAAVSRRAGARVALRVERRYVSAVLPGAVARNVVHSIRWRDPSGLRAATMIVLVLAVTATGYARGRLRHCHTRT